MADEKPVPLVMAKPPKSDWTPPVEDLRGKTPETWKCIDCGFDTAPGCLGREQMEQAFALKDSIGLHITGQSEVYMVKPKVWKAAGMNAGQGGFGDQDGDSGCLCIGCLEKRIGRRLTPKDFSRNHEFNDFPGSVRLISRWTDVPEGVVAEMRAEGVEPVRRGK
ncbi:MAG TPA: hypothetical protein VNY08_08135 [Bradyrhizobium sp.]|jgi:hypothetical protein|nr:hypothetical protein [Bradyrhizobium sp.]